MADITEYFEIMAAGDEDSLRLIFADEPDLDDPRAGRITDDGALAEFCREYPDWLGGGTAEIIAVTETDERVVPEFVLGVVRDGREVPLPVAIAADKAGVGGAGDVYSRIRVYHSLWPLLGRHTLRSAILPEESSLVIPDVIGRYHDDLTRGDLEDMMALFEDDGYAREPAGGEWVYEGKERLREFYGMLFAGGGIVLEHCTYTDDGVRGALEYNAMSWGRTPLNGQAGIAVYERGAGGRLHAARIYDDVNPPE